MHKRAVRTLLREYSGLESALEGSPTPAMLAWGRKAQSHAFRRAVRPRSRSDCRPCNPLRPTGQVRRSRRRSTDWSPCPAAHPGHGRDMHVHALDHVVLKAQEPRALGALLHQPARPSRLAPPDRVIPPDVVLGNQHDFALMKFGNVTQPAPRTTGLAHVAFKVGDALEEVGAAMTQLFQTGGAIAGEMEALAQRMGLS